MNKMGKCQVTYNHHNKHNINKYKPNYICVWWLSSSVDLWVANFEFGVNGIPYWFDNCLPVNFGLTRNHQI